MAPTAAQKRKSTSREWPSLARNSSQTDSCHTGKLKDFLEADSSPAVTEAKRAKLAMLTSEELVDRVFALEAEVVLLNGPLPLSLGNGAWVMAV